MPSQNQSNKQYQNDQWTLNDDLGLGAVGDQVARMVLEVEPPFTIGVTGKWGSGKTSILRRSYTTLGGLPLQQPLAFAAAGQEHIADAKLEWKLRKKQLGWSESVNRTALNTHCVWFSPWQHQNEDNPLIPLLLEIQSQFTAWTKMAKVGGNVLRRGALAAVTLLERVTDAAVTLHLGKNIKIAGGLTKEVHKAWQDGAPNLTTLSDGQRFHLLFEDAINAILMADQPDESVPEFARMVIFIDDLDRCEESVMVRLLEAIKLYLCSNRCVFVLGLDDTAVINALNRHWIRGEDLNREYLEKLFQTRLLVPLPQPTNITTTIQAQLQCHQIEAGYSEVMAADIEQLLEPNPRKVKNFVNSLCAAWAVLGAQQWVNAEDEARRFVMFHYIQQYHRSVWRLLERQPEALKFLWAVVTSADPTVVDAMEIISLDPQAQRLMKEMFRRAFSHVLKDVVNSDDNNKHGTEDLDKAVANFIERQDRKRSDEYLKGLMDDLLTIESRLDGHYLYAVQLKK